MVWWLLRTKLLCPQARLIRFPFDIRGKRYIDLGRNLTTGIGCRLEAFSADRRPTMHFGRNVQLNDYVHICAMQDVTIAVGQPARPVKHYDRTSQSWLRI